MTDRLKKEEFVRLLAARMKTDEATGFPCPTTFVVACILSSDTSLMNCSKMKYKLRLMESITLLMVEKVALVTPHMLQ